MRPDQLPPELRAQIPANAKADNVLILDLHEDRFGVGVYCEELSLACRGATIEEALATMRGMVEDAKPGEQYGALVRLPDAIRGAEIVVAEVRLRDDGRLEFVPQGESEGFTRGRAEPGSAGPPA